MPISVPPLNHDQALLLQAALATDDAAFEAWESWVQATDFENVDDYSFLLLGLLYVNVGSLIEDHPLKGRLRGIHRQNWAKTQLTLQQCQPVFDALTAAGCVWSTTQGTALVQHYYPDAGTRRLDSAAIWVAPQHREIAVNTLQAMGWQGTAPNKQHWQHPQGGRLEIQSVDPLPTSVVTTHISDAKPSPTLLMWQVCIEGVSWRNYPRLIWIADAVMILRRSGDQIDWLQLEDWARRYHLTLRLSAAVQHIRAYAADDIPIFDFDRSAVPILERLEYALIVERRSENIFARFLRLYIRYWREKNFKARGWDFPHYFYEAWKQRSISRQTRGQQNG